MVVGKSIFEYTLGEIDNNYPHQQSLKRTASVILENPRRIVPLQGDSVIEGIMKLDDLPFQDITHIAFRDSKQQQIAHKMTPKLMRELCYLIQIKNLQQEVDGLKGLTKNF